jgi:hypothetical protein
MTLLTGKTMVKCPVDKAEVEVSSGCSLCKYFGHLNMRGFKLLVACNYETKQGERTA